MFPSLTRHLLFVASLALLVKSISFGHPQPQKSKAAEPKRLAFAEAQRLLEGEREGNLANRPNSFTCTRLRAGRVLELYYPVTVTRRTGRARTITAAGYGLLYESEADYKESKRPRHILEDLIPDGEVFVANVPQLVARLQKRLGVGAKGLDYSRASLRRIDFYLAAYQRRHTTAEADPQLFQELTAYYGETLRRVLGGEWRVRREPINQAVTHPVPNLALGASRPSAPAELKPWGGILAVLYDEDRRGTSLASIFDTDLEAARKTR